MTHKYEPLWETATNALVATVADLTARFGGGTPFFDAMDERMRDPLYFEALVTKALDEFPNANNIVVSGRFGKVFAPWLLHSEFGRLFPPALLVPGNLRHEDMPRFKARLGEALPTLRYVDPQEGVKTLDIEEKSSDRFVFLDDSAFKFRTFNKIKERVDEAGGDVIGHVVLYDGSREPQRIPSFYRWHSAEGASE